MLYAMENYSFQIKRYHLHVMDVLYIAVPFRGSNVSVVTKGPSMTNLLSILVTPSLSHYLANMGCEVPEIKMHLFRRWV